MRRPGNHPAIREAVQAFYLFLDGWDAVNAFTPAYRESVRGHIPPRAFVSLWRDCYALACLAGLTRAVYQHSGTVVESFDEPWFDQAGDDFAGCHCG